MAKRQTRTTPVRPGGRCVWCKKAIDAGVDTEWHVSLLGAPGQFHKACFTEYQSAATP